MASEPSIVVVLFGLMFLSRVAVHFLDKTRVQKAAHCQGLLEVDVTWAPLSAGALFEKNERSYKVTGVDEDGARIIRYCKTSLGTGVYWRDGQL